MHMDGLLDRLRDMSRARSGDEVRLKMPRGTRARRICILQWPGLVASEDLDLAFSLDPGDGGA